MNSVSRIRGSGFRDRRRRPLDPESQAIFGSLIPEPRYPTSPYFLTAPSWRPRRTGVMTSAVRSRPGSAQTTPESAMSNTMCRPFSVATCFEDRIQLVLELLLQLVLELLHFRLGVLLGELNVALHLLDVLLELRRAPDRSAPTRPAAAWSAAPEAPCSSRRARCLLLLSVIELGRRQLPLDRVRGDRLDVHEGDLRALGERRGGRGRGSRRLCGWSRRRGERSAPGVSASACPEPELAQSARLPRRRTARTSRRTSVEIVSFSFVAFLALAISGTFCTLM